MSTTYAVNGRPTTVDDFQSTSVAVQNTGTEVLFIEPLGRQVPVGQAVTVPGWSTRRTRVRTAGQNGTAVVTLTAGTPAAAPGPGGVTFDPGPAASVSLSISGGTWYSNEGLTTAVSFPVSLVAPTVLYPAAAGSITVTAVVGGTTQVRGMNVNEGSAEGFTWVPSTDAERAAAGVSAGTGTYAGIGGPLTRYRTKLATSPTTTKIVVNGDSTSNEPSGAGQLYSALRQYATRLGEPLYGLPSDVFTDGVTTNLSPTLSSATAAFTSADIGRATLISTTKVPATATIIAVAADGLSCTMSQNATANGTSVKFQVGRSIVGLGYSGLTLGGWLADTTKQAELIAQNPDLIIASWGINDMRIGLTDLATMTTRLQSYIAWVATNLPNADLLLRIPNAMLSQNVGALGYVTAADGTVNPTGAAQSYSKDLRSAYLAVKARGYAHVDVIDTQAEVTGTISRFSHPDMADQLHPSVSGDQSNPTSGGYVAIARWVAGYIGRTPWGGAWKNDTLRGYGTTQEFRISGGGVGYVDLTSLGSVSIDPAHWPIDKNWSLIIPGIDAVLALTAVTVTRPISGGTGARLQGLPSPANAVDFSATTYLNQTVILVNTAAGREPTTNDRQVVAIDLPSIAAGATVTQTVAVTGAIAGTSGSAAGISQANAVVVTPPSTFSASGLLLFAAYPTAADTVTLIVNNPTAGAIDRSSENWAFWVVR